MPSPAQKPTFSRYADESLVRCNINAAPRHGPEEPDLPLQLPRLVLRRMMPPRSGPPLRTREADEDEDEDEDGFLADMALKALP